VRKKYHEMCVPRGIEIWSCWYRYIDGIGAEQKPVVDKTPTFTSENDLSEAHGHRVAEALREEISRNNPRPCGSGRKFKKCCVGKGIYD
jgi:SEC-C motif.